MPPVLVVVTRVAKVPPSSKYDPGLVTLRRSTVVASLVAATVLAGWSAGATWLILARDSFAGHMIKRETARQYVYEDRIAALKSEIDKLSSRQLVDQDGVEARMAELVTRQSQLETRHAIVAALAESISGPQLAAGRPARLPAGAVVPPGPVAGNAISPATTSSIGASSSFAPSPRPMPVPEMPGLRREGERNTVASQGWEQSAADLPVPPPLETGMARVERGLAQVAAAQIKALSRLDATLNSAQASLRQVVADVGLDADRLAAAARSPGQGGPFIPAQIDSRAGPFEANVARIQPRIAQVERLRSVVNALPLRRPMGADAEQSSAFGHRLDPFTRALAMHSGVDFRAEHGSPVLSAAAGKVVLAEYHGGYGNMVEIDHGNGITTRYAHLSHIAVNDGQQVAVGTVVGRVGSTGRSTGPHLHYETRIEGDAVDPARFLRAGQRFLAQAR
jgi:murein DD-endopeptidase MepM/ murein hydrolase activator NlpD